MRLLQYRRLIYELMRVYLLVLGAFVIWKALRIVLFPYSAGGFLGNYVDRRLLMMSAGAIVFALVPYMLKLVVEMIDRWKPRTPSKRIEY